MKLNWSQTEARKISGLNFSGVLERKAIPSWIDEK